MASKIVYDKYLGIHISIDTSEFDKNRYAEVDSDGFVIPEKTEGKPKSQKVETPKESKEQKEVETNAKPKTPNPVQEEKSEETDTTLNRDNLVKLIVSLDTEDDANWTRGGDPAMSVLEAVFGEALTRRQVRELAPEFDRDYVRAYQSSGK